LVIIDGVPGDLSQLNPNDIESVTVLKDAAASIYGARAAGGVLLVTTKQGKTDKPQVVVNASYSLTKPTEYFKAPNAIQAAEMMLEAAKNAGQNNPYVDEQFLNDLKAGKVHPVNEGWGTLFTGSWDYAKLTIGTGNQQNYDISLSGSGKSDRYRASIGYTREKGILKYGADNTSRFNTLLNYDFDINNKLKINAILGFSQKKTQMAAYTNVFNRINSMMPFMRPRVLEDSTKWATAQNFYNPMQMLADGGTNNYKTTEINPNLKLDYKLIKDLTLTGQVGANYTFSNSSSFNRTVNLYDPVDGTIHGMVNNPNSGTLTEGTTVYYTLIGYANYAKSFDNLNNISITLGGSHEQNNYKTFSAGRKGFPSNDFFSLNLGDGETQTNDEGGSAWAISSMFGRATYIYNSKYIFDANFRYDGSSRFAPETRWGLFWGASAAWRLSEEKFIKNLKIFNDLKLRVSYGETGNQDGIGLYDYVQRIDIGGAYPFGNGAKIANASLGPLVDRTRTWETIQTKNVGLDFGLFKEKLSGSFDYFI
jgi:TonB-linked SusC/RagA family outer membrane protein